MFEMFEMFGRAGNYGKMLPKLSQTIHLTAALQGRFPPGRIFRAQRNFLLFKAASHVTIFMHGVRAKGKIQRNNYQDVQCGPCFGGKTSSLPLIHPCTKNR